jgi:hypothetical protein
MEHGPRPGRAGRGERAPAEQRVDVVGVHDAYAVLADRAGDLLRVAAAGEQPGGGLGRAQPLARALEHLDRVASAGEQRRQVSDRALLTADRAVAVVQDEDHTGGDEGARCTSTATCDGPGPSSFGPSAPIAGGVKSSPCATENRSTT